MKKWNKGQRGGGTYISVDDDDDDVYHPAPPRVPTPPPPAQNDTDITDDEIIECFEKWWRTKTIDNPTYLTKNHAKQIFCMQKNGLELKRRYRILMLKYHPDKKREHDAHAKSQFIIDAYNKLKEGGRRKTRRRPNTQKKRKTKRILIKS